MSYLKVSTRTSILLIIWILVSAAIGLLTGVLNWMSTPFNFISFVLLIGVVISVLADNAKR